MIEEAALITISCVLFIKMGLADAVQEILHIGFRIVSCPKCLGFWVCLMWNALHDYDILESVAVSFICSYSALWLSLIYDVMATLYNYIYEQITETTDASEESETDATATDSDEVS